MSVRVLAISGSLRVDSHNTALLRAAADLLPPDVELVIAGSDLLRALPPFDEDGEHEPGDAVDALRGAIAEADALLVSTPEYNGSIPGVLKNAVDWASRPVRSTVLRGKPAAVIGASTGMFGAVWAQADLRKVLTTAGARVLDRELAVPSAGQGALLEAELEEELASILQALADAVAEREASRAA